MKYLDYATCILVFIGALNWGLIGAFGFNLVSFLFSDMMIQNIIYVLVGLSAVYKVIKVATCGSCGCCCSSSSCSTPKE